MNHISEDQRGHLLAVDGHNLHNLHLYFKGRRAVHVVYAAGQLNRLSREVDAFVEVGLQNPITARNAADAARSNLGLEGGGFGVLVNFPDDELG